MDKSVPKMEDTERKCPEILVVGSIGVADGNQLSVKRESR